VLGIFAISPLIPQLHLGNHPKGTWKGAVNLASNHRLAVTSSGLCFFWRCLRTKASAWYLNLISEFAQLADFCRSRTTSKLYDPNPIDIHWS
jgi:hypothetical protein